MPWCLTGGNTLSAETGTSFMPAGPSVKFHPLSANVSRTWKTYLSETWKEVRIYLSSQPLDEAACSRIYDMVASPVSIADRLQFSWPIDVVVSADGVLVGYIASFVRNMVSLASLLPFSGGPSSRELGLRIGRNLCVAFAAFHSYGFVFGNLNVHSVLVDESTCRVFLDPGLNVQFLGDSQRRYSIFECTPEYLPPETHRSLALRLAIFSHGRGIPPDEAKGKALSVKTERARMREQASPNTDAFALGVILYGILDKGCHPLSCVEGGEKSIPPLMEIPIYPSAVSATSSAMTGNYPRTSIRKKNFGVPNYRLFWKRTRGRARLFDACFDARTEFSDTDRPSAQDWHDLLDRESSGTYVRFARMLRDVRSHIAHRKRMVQENAASDHVRKAIRALHPSDVAGSEPVSSPRVFWRTTILFAFTVLLCMLAGGFNALAAVLTAGGLSLAGMNAHALCMGCLCGLLLANVAAARSRGMFGYRCRHYAASFTASTLSCAAFGVVAGVLA